MSGFWGRTGFLRSKRENPRLNSAMSEEPHEDSVGESLLNADTRQVWRNEKEVHLSPKAFELLMLLVVNRPRALSKRELHEAIWPATLVKDDSRATHAPIGIVGLRYPR